MSRRNLSTTFRNRARWAAAAAAVTAACALALVAADAQPAPGWNHMPLSDAEFVGAIDASNTAELDEAKYVVNRTKNPDVHAFAQRMIDDHSTAAVQLSAVTRGTNLRPEPAPRGTGGMRDGDGLQSESGTALDDHYMRMQVRAHRRALALLQWESQNGQIAGLKTLAMNMTAVVQQHLQMAQSYLTAHNLTPDRPGTPNGTTQNNPASGPANGSSSGQNAPSGTGPVNPAPGATPTVPLSTGTAPPPASPSPRASSQP